ncbi:hypothetical protein [Cellulosimicrobium cellulans]|uniref:hypothetical protein n=1 Tax=Cellulosimicrobium cellulans TaxID=1710 RepID=UPI002097B427|nr:hypothetical protein [Cellulosimicrobium cellulans]MCO7273730.1 hypothetical protein [Cellulosimicrobium cellulans]
MSSSSPPPPPPCDAAPFGVSLARARVLTAQDDVARAGAALVAPDLPWAGHARASYDDAAAEQRGGLLRLGMLLDSCLLRLDALTVLAEAEVARIRAELAAAGLP